MKPKQSKKKKIPCLRKQFESPAFCKQPALPPFSNIFLLIHTSWSFLISPQCLGIAVFLEANLSAFADDSLGLNFLKKVPGLLNSLFFSYSNFLTLKQTWTSLLTFEYGGMLLKIHIAYEFG